jgi:excisionase family DNA binding protein
MKYEEMLTTNELAHVLKTSLSTVKRLRADGYIRGYKIRRQLRFLLSEVKADLGRMEKDFELRKVTGRLIESGGSPHGRFTSLKGKLSANVIDLDREGVEDAEEAETED